jgi:hypothetical protein
MRRVLVLLLLGRRLPVRALHAQHVAVALLAPRDAACSLQRLLVRGWGGPRQRRRPLQHRPAVRLVRAAQRERKPVAKALVLRHEVARVRADLPVRIRGRGRRVQRSEHVAIAEAGRRRGATTWLRRGSV